MNLSLPQSNVELTDKSWYNFFSNIYRKVIGYFDSSLTATITKDTDTAGNVGGTETAISNFLIPKSRLSKNEVVEIYAGGTRAANGNNKTIRIKLNSTTVYTNTVATSGGSWQVRVTVINLGTSQKVFIENAGASTYTTASIDTSTTDIDVILTLQGVATDDIVKEYFEVGYNS